MNPQDVSRSRTPTAVGMSALSQGCRCPPNHPNYSRPLQARTLGTQPPTAPGKSNSRNPRSKRDFSRPLYPGFPDPPFLGAGCQRRLAHHKCGRTVTTRQPTPGGVVERYPQCLWEELQCPQCPGAQTTLPTEFPFPLWGGAGAERGCHTTHNAPGRDYNARDAPWRGPALLEMLRGHEIKLGTLPCSPGLRYTQCSWSGVCNNHNVPESRRTLPRLQRDGLYSHNAPGRMSPSQRALLDLVVQWGRL